MILIYQLIGFWYISQYSWYLEVLWVGFIVWMFFFDCAMLDWLLNIIVTPKKWPMFDNTANFCMYWRLNYVFRCNNSSNAVWKRRWICSIQVYYLWSIGIILFCNVTMSRVPTDQFIFFFFIFTRVCFSCTLFQFVFFT